MLNLQGAQYELVRCIALEHGHHVSVSLSFAGIKRVC